MTKKNPIRLVGPSGGKEKLTKKLLEQKYIQQPIHNFLSRVGAWFEGAWKERVSVGVSGRYRNSIEHKVNGFQSVTIFSPVKYAVHREFGTKPHWVPRSALARWAYLKRIPVFLVQRAIARRGTKAENAIGRAVEASPGPVNRMMDRLAKEVQTAWGQR